MTDKVTIPALLQMTHDAPDSFGREATMSLLFGHFLPICALR